MLQLTPQSRIFLAIEPVDFRAGIDRLVTFCRERLAQNPLEGAVYVFRNRPSTALKLLVYDGQGFWLCYPAPVTGPVPMVAPRRDRGLALVRP
jgi:transposase